VTGFRKWTAVVMMAIVVAAACLYVVRRERSLAVAFATRSVEDILRHPAEAAKYAIPAGVMGTAFSLADTDHFERTWFLWFTLDTGGSLAVKVSARRGVGFVPAFNTEGTLAIESVEYIR
jgi:hypothetical protein